MKTQFFMIKFKMPLVCLHCQCMVCSYKKISSPSCSSVLSGTPLVLPIVYWTLRYFKKVLQMCLPAHGLWGFERGLCIRYLQVQIIISIRSLFSTYAWWYPKVNEASSSIKTFSNNVLERKGRLTVN